jgi:integrase
VHRVPAINKRTGAPFVAGKKRDMGLGTVKSVSLAWVRKRAQECRELIAAKKDPLDEQDSVLAAARAAKIEQAANAKRQITLLAALRDYHERIVEPNRTTKHAMQWIHSVEQHVPENMLKKPISTIQPQELLDLILELRGRIRETARRVQQRLGMVFADAKLRGLVTSNPIADIAHALRESTRDKTKHRKNFASLPYTECPAFVQKLRGMPGTAARALEVTILCAGRTKEVLEAPWSEIDLDKALWTIPAARMKAGEPVVFRNSTASLKPPACQRDG